jgi:outer membrane protein assembly factor BamE (lipoprotein component of BamABCDE complex)
MKKLAAIIPVIILSLFAISCLQPYPSGVNTLTLNLTIGSTRPAEIVEILGSPSYVENVSGYETYSFNYTGSVLRVYVDMPSGQDDKIIMINGASDVLHTTFNNDGVLASAY